MGFEHQFPNPHANKLYAVPLMTQEKIDNIKQGREVIPT
jgi:hypothetical protein